MKSFAIAALMSVAAANIESEFMKYLTQHGKSYGTREEFMFRLQRFIEADAEIEALNSDETQYATFGHNKFSDWTEEEMNRIRGGRKPESHEQTITFGQIDENSWKTINWVNQGVLHPIQNQGSCGSCWSFATTAAMEAADSIQRGRLGTKLSEQQLVDCSSSYGNHSCDWGYAASAYSYASDNYMESENSYPYRGYVQSCRYNSSQGVLRLRDYHNVAYQNPNDMYSALRNNPLSVAIYSSSREFSSYRSGVMNASCPNNSDHIVAVVGYGVESGQEYWLVRNSWGTNWGDNGYIKMAKNNTSGASCIQNWPNYPIM